MQKFKLGDRVQMTKKCIKQHVDSMKEYYSKPCGEISAEYNNELSALFAARYLDMPLIGYVVGYGATTDGFEGGTDRLFTKVCLTNRFGTFQGFVLGQHLLRKKRQ
jgi:hypothetical protein